MNESKNSTPHPNKQTLAASGGDWLDGQFETSDSIKLFYRIYRPASPRKSLIILHGFGEHSHRYEKFSRFFPDFQITVYDMRGMGQSGGETVWVESFDRYEQDALEFISYVEKKYDSAIPRVLLGHSLGGLNLMRLAIHHHVPAERFVFSAPCFRIAVPTFALEWNRLVNQFFPHFLYHHPVHYQFLSHDPFETLSYKNDPWIMKDMSARLLSEMTRVGKWVTNLNTIALDVPVHFMLAGDDKLVKTKIALSVYEKISAPNKTVKIYKNFYHEIFNEVDQHMPFSDLRNLFSC